MLDTICEHGFAAPINYGYELQFGITIIGLAPEMAE